GSQTTYRIYIGRYVKAGQSSASVGDPPSRVKWVNFGANSSLGLTNISFNVGGSPTITPHSAAVNAMSVGAVEYWAQQGFASFTSQGPSTIIFNPNGTRLGSPVVRDKPDFTALQSTNTTFFY